MSDEDIIKSTIYIKYNLFAEITWGCYCKKYDCNKRRAQFIPTDMELAKEFKLLGNDNIPRGFL